LDYIEEELRPQMRPSVTPTGIERFFEEDEIIVSKTDPKGIITYANQVFLRVAQYEEEEVLLRLRRRRPEKPRKASTASPGPAGT
jgi:PAS domain-containing protein